MLRDLVHAEITFKELARITGIGEKSLHRTLSRHGNPRASTLGKVVLGIRECLGFIPQVSVATASAGKEPGHGIAGERPTREVKVLSDVAQ